MANPVNQVNGRKFFGIYMASGNYFNLSPSTALTNGEAFNPMLNNSGFTSARYAELLAKSTIQGIGWTAHESPWYVDTWIA
jgi:hypothetical protein